MRDALVHSFKPPKKLWQESEEGIDGYIGIEHWRENSKPKALGVSYMWKAGERRQREQKIGKLKPRGKKCWHSLKMIQRMASDFFLSQIHKECPKKCSVVVRRERHTNVRISATKKKLRATYTKRSHRGKHVQNFIEHYDVVRVKLLFGLFFVHAVHHRVRSQPRCGLPNRLAHAAPTFDQIHAIPGVCSAETQRCKSYTENGRHSKGY